jgi:hypothetical protein
LTPAPYCAYFTASVVSEKFVAKSHERFFSNARREKRAKRAFFLNITSPF